MGNREAVRQQVDPRLLMFKCSCVKKGNKCGPSCRCKNCSNTRSPTGTQQQSSDGLVEIEEEELLHNDSLKRERGEVCER